MLVLPQSLELTTTVLGDPDHRQSDFGQSLVFLVLCNSLISGISTRQL